LIASTDKNLGTPEKIYYSESMSKLLCTTDKKKLLGFDNDSKSFSELKIVNNTTEWEQTTAIATYSTNIYLLDSTSDKLLKHTLNENIYTKGTTYVDTKKISLKNAIDEAIDGNLFILFKDGSVNKFVKGALEPDFVLKNIPTPNNKIEEASKIFTDENTNSIFVLDKKLNRILKFNKSGDYTSQYIFDGISIDDFVINAKLQKIWALSSGKIYEGNL